VRRLLVSFSGGETSALMAKLIRQHWADRYDEIVFVFANTSEENEETLEFAHYCDEAFWLNLVWVEAVVDPEPQKGTTHRVVTFETAARDGSVFEAVIAKYGIPGLGQLHCTRELKERPIRSYARSIGWRKNSYDMAIGMRTDEIDRQNPNAAALRLIYPLIKPWPTSRAGVNQFWQRQNRRLNLKSYQGNCKTCWKKSLRKLLTIMRENPAAFDFFETMEKRYPTTGRGSRPNTVRRFFRGELAVEDLRRMASQPFDPAEDEARVYQTDMLQGLELDVGGACGESCEVFSS
jgi:hypothetical protein